MNRQHIARAAASPSYSHPFGSGRQGLSGIDLEKFDQESAVQATTGDRRRRSENSGEDTGRRDYASPGPKEETALSELPFQPTSRQNPISVYLPDDNGFSAVTVAVESVGDNLSYGKILPGVGNKVPKAVEMEWTSP